MHEGNYTCQKCGMVMRLHCLSCKQEMTTAEEQANGKCQTCQQEESDNLEAAAEENYYEEQAIKQLIREKQQ